MQAVPFLKGFPDLSRQAFWQVLKLAPWFGHVPVAAKAATTLTVRANQQAVPWAGICCLFMRRVVFMGFSVGFFDLALSEHKPCSVSANCLAFSQNDRAAIARVGSAHLTVSTRKQTEASPPAR